MSPIAIYPYPSAILGLELSQTPSTNLIQCWVSRSHRLTFDLINEQCWGCGLSSNGARMRPSSVARRVRVGGAGGADGLGAWSMEV